VRRISVETAFLGIAKGIVFDDEILADSLTRYFTDYEPDACWVALDQGRVIGYLIGTKDAKTAERVTFGRIVPPLFLKALCRGAFSKRNNWRFLGHLLLSLIHGEFASPDFSKDYPAMLHINIDKEFRGRSIGRRLVEQYLSFLKEEGLPGVHFGTLSQEAKIFFDKLGFKVLFEGRRSYLRSYLGRDVAFTIFGKRL
jgi:ribosomal protein S18 acetylase RimI-like enzyme